jgi:hypothetical protein
MKWRPNVTTSFHKAYREVVKRERERETDFTREGGSEVLIGEYAQRHRAGRRGRMQPMSYHNMTARVNALLQLDSLNLCKISCKIGKR